MEGTKQVKVDNWGVFFLQRLKHFFNKTDYCDLTLQFQDYAQLKVHRLVLNACTEYFEILERTCEMYDDCLIMPDDLQADVVVPIVNFMYTGQLEYDYELFDRLYSTASVMNMTVLTKLLDAQKATSQQQLPPVPQRKEITMLNDSLDRTKPSRVFTRDHPVTAERFNPKKFIPGKKYGPGPGIKPDFSKPKPPQPKQPKIPDSPRPTRYEVPEELENEEIFEASFADISYETRPLFKTSIKTEKLDEEPKRTYDEASSSRKFEELKRSMNFVKKSGTQQPAPSISEPEKNIDLEQINEFAYQQKLRAEYAKNEMSDDEGNDNYDSFDFDRNSTHSNEEETSKVNLESGTSMTVEAKSNLDHAKIISEVLKKYPHLVKSNRNIKLKIMAAPKKPKVEKRKSLFTDDDSKPNYTFVSKNSDAMEKLVSLGVANTKGPWLCFICGVPGIALTFPTYNKYFRHLVDVHKEKTGANICEHCGYKTGKRNHLLHHLYTKHDIPPPPTHHFPKCNQCNYVALTEAFLIKHKLGHGDNKEYTCNVCNFSYKNRSQLFNHIQLSGHKITPDRKASNQCVYCNKIFLREANLYTHLKLMHKETARKDGIIDNSDEEDSFEGESSTYEFESGSRQEHVNIKEEYDGKIHIVSNVNYNAPQAQYTRNQVKVLNANLAKREFENPMRKRQRIDSNYQPPKANETNYVNVIQEDRPAEIELGDHIVILNDNEYILQTDQLEMDGSAQEILLSEIPEEDMVHAPDKSHDPNINTIVSTEEQPIQIVVSNDQHYETIVSSAPLIYTTTVADLKSSDESSSHSQENIIVENNAFQIAGTIPEDGSNIMVVYKDKPVHDPQTQQIESQLAELHGEEHSIEEEISDQNIVHETVETWTQTIVDNSGQNVDKMVGVEIENEIPVEEIHMETEEIVKHEMDESEVVTEEVSISEEPTEVVNSIEEVASVEESTEQTEPAEITENSIEDIESTEVVEPSEEITETVEEVDEPTEEIEEVKADAIEEQPEIENLDEDKSQTCKNNEVTIDENEHVEELKPDVIENLEPQDVSIESVDDVQEESVVSEESVEIESKKSEDTVIEQTDSVIKENEPTVVQDENSKKPENISHLLEDWEDNDSQAETIVENNDHSETMEVDSQPEEEEVVEEDEEAMEVESVQNETPVIVAPVVKDANIEKLVSDWDDD